MKNSAAKPPASLAPEARRMWAQLQCEYGITDEGGLIILTAACEAFMRMREAQQLIKEEGLTFENRFGQRKPHPAVIIERDCRGQMLAALKQLNLDLEMPRDRSRNGAFYAVK